MMKPIKRVREEELEEEEEPGRFYGQGMTWFRGPMIRTESSDLMEDAMVLDDLHGCPHIRQMLGKEFTATAKRGKTVTNLLLEYCSGGNLAQLIKKTGGSTGRGLPESSVRQYTRQILLGLNRIHKEGYVYSALQPKNILLVPRGDDTGCTGTSEYIAKIGDLGFAGRVNEVRKVKNFGGSTDVKYMAPEALVENVQEPCSDIWSLGCVVVEMLLGFPMWNGMEDSEIENFLYDMAEGKYCEAKIIGRLSDEGKDFLKKCLVPKDERSTAERLLNHQFVRELEEENSTDKAIEAVEEALEEVNTLSRSALVSTEVALKAAKEVLDAAKEVLEAACKVACSEKSQLSGLTMSEDFIPLRLDDEGPDEKEKKKKVSDWTITMTL